MKITESITPLNANRTILGSREIMLTLDTETKEVAITKPAMFPDPVVSLSDLQIAIDKLVEMGRYENL